MQSTTTQFELNSIVVLTLSNAKHAVLGYIRGEKDRNGLYKIEVVKDSKDKLTVCYAHEDELILVQP